MSKETKLDKYQERAKQHLDTYATPVLAKINSRLNGKHLIEVDKTARSLGISRSEFIRVMMIQATQLGPDSVFVGDIGSSDNENVLHWKTKAASFEDALKKAEEQVLHWKTEAEHYINENKETTEALNLATQNHGATLKELDETKGVLDEVTQQHGGTLKELAASNKRVEELTETNGTLAKSVTESTSKLEVANNLVKTQKGTIDEGKRRVTELQFENQKLNDQLSRRFGFGKRIKILFTGRP